MNRLEFISTQPSEVKKQLLQQAAKDYAFTVYLRKGIHIDPGVFVKDILEEDAFIQTLKEQYGAIPTFSAPWTRAHFYAHFLFGQGQTLSLRQTGYLELIKEHAENGSGQESPLRRFKRQICGEAHKRPVGPFEVYFEGSYDFQPVQWAIRMAKLSGTFSGETYWKDGRRLFSGSAGINFFDDFQDPYDITQVLQELRIINVPSEWVTRLSNRGGNTYTIEDFWTISIEGDTEFCKTYGSD